MSLIAGLCHRVIQDEPILTNPKFFISCKESDFGLFLFFLAFGSYLLDYYVEILS